MKTTIARRVATAGVAALLFSSLSIAQTVQTAEAAPGTGEERRAEAALKREEAQAEAARKREEAQAQAALKRNKVELQLLSFNDFHGHLEATDGPLTRVQDPSQTPVGGAEYLAATLAELREGHKNTLTVAAGDLIGGSTFLSGMFHDEPAIESLNAMKLDVSGVGNHEFDEGTTELLRIQNGGCHPVDGCYFPEDPYAGADFQYLAANVIRKDTGDTLLPATTVKNVNGVKVGFIGMTLEGTDTLVSPAGVATVDFADEVDTANAQAAELRRRGVEAIIVLLHEGGYQTGNYQGCTGISDPIVDIAVRMDPAIDMIVSGHTHQPYVCSIPDPAGNDRTVASAADYGRVVTESNLVLDRKTKDVDRELSRTTNHLVARNAVSPDPTQTEIIAKWDALAGPQKAEVVGTHTEDILGDSSTTRDHETPMANLVADAILWGTDEPAEGGAQIALMNVGGVREDLPMAPKYAEGSGQITFQEAYDIAPFGNLLVTLDLTGAQLEEVLEQQYVPGRSRENLALGVSDGFSYEWDATQPRGNRVVPGSMTLNGTPIEAGQTYRVATLSFLAEGGDQFTAFTAGTNLVGGPEDLANLVDYFEANPGLEAHPDRVKGL